MRLSSLIDGGSSFNSLLELQELMFGIEFGFDLLHGRNEDGKMLSMKSDFLSGQGLLKLDRAKFSLHGNVISAITIEIQ